MACESESQSLSMAIAYRNAVLSQKAFTEQQIAAYQAALVSINAQLVTAEQGVVTAQEAYANCINGG